MTQLADEGASPQRRRVLITGAAGFVGSHLAERCLTDGDEVLAFDNFNDFYDPDVKRRNLSDAKRNPRFTLVEADIRDRSAVMASFSAFNPTHVVHLAAMAGVRPSIERPDYYTEVNVTGTQAVLEAAVRSEADQFIFGSSSSVYGNNENVPFAEHHRVDNPISPYAATKRAGELLCHTYAHLHGMPIACLRFFTVFGPRQRPDLAIQKFLTLVADGQPLPLFGDGSSSRDYTYVDDIVGGVIAAMGHLTTPGGYWIYNLGGDHPMRLDELVRTIERVVGRDVSIERHPEQPGDVTRTWADLTASEHDLGYRPKTAVELGIQRQWSWITGQDQDGRIAAPSS